MKHTTQYVKDRIRFMCKDCFALLGKIHFALFCNGSFALLGTLIDGRHLRDGAHRLIDGRHLQGGAHHYLALLVVLIGMLWLPLTAGAGDSVCAEVKIEIKQELTLERQAFEAHMRINNGLSNITLDHVSVTVNFLDEEGNPVQATSNPATNLETTLIPFFIRLDTTNNLSNLQKDPNNLDFTGTVNPSTSADIYWLIIPTLAAADEEPEGKVYYVGATLSYTIAGEAHSTEVTPDYIFVKPLPELALDYFLPDDVYGDDAWTPETEPPVPFSLGVRVSNRGYGTAWNLTINSAQPTIVSNLQGLLIDFLITGSEVNGQPATESLLVDFGDLGSETVGVARWNMSCSLSGVFEEFTATLSHADELGGELTSLIRELNTHTLVRDVLVDLPGRDGVRDFLATDRDNPGVWYRLFESENTETPVTDLSASAAFVLLDEATGTYGLIPSTPLSFPEGFLYARKEIPTAVGEAGAISAVRADGKVIRPENIWISKTRKSNPQEGWEYFVHLFDGNATDPASGLPFSYTVVFGSVPVVPQPPVLEVIPDQTRGEGQLLSFTVAASCAQGLPCTPALSAAPLPAGAMFTDYGDGTGTFDWTPAVGQAGVYSVTFEASDGELSASQQVTITITTELSYTITATAGANGSITPSGAVTVAYGADQAFTITPDAGYHIADVLVDGVSIGAVSTYTFSNVTETHTIEVTFAINTYTITATAGANGSITPSGDVTVEYGADQNFMITPDPGYDIADVLVDGSSIGAVSAYTFTNAMEDHTIAAMFSATLTPTPTPTPQPLTISGQVRTSDGFTGMPEVALNGLPGSPTTNDLGYYQAEVESGWSGTVTPQKLDYRFTPVFRSYSSLMVNMEQQDYTATAPSQTLTIVLAGEGSGVVTGDGGLNCGTVCTVSFEKYTQVYLSVIPDAGSVFARAVGAECTPEGTCVLTMTEDTTITVTFGVELEPSPTPTVGPEPTPTPMTPVIPEPTTGFLMMLGLLALLGLGLGGWRKKK